MSKSVLITGGISFFVVYVLFYCVVEPYKKIKDLQNGMQQQQDQILRLTDQLRVVTDAMNGGGGGGGAVATVGKRSAISDSRGLVGNKDMTTWQNKNTVVAAPPVPPSAPPAEQRVKPQRQVRRARRQPPSQLDASSNSAVTSTNAKDKTKMTIEELELAFHQERYRQLQEAPVSDMLVWNASNRIADPFIGLDGASHPGGHRIYDRLLNNFDYCELYGMSDTLPADKSCKFVLARGDKVQMGGLCHAASVITNHRKKHNVALPHVLLFSFHEDFGGMLKSPSSRGKRRMGCNEEQVWEYINHPDTIAAFTVQTHYADHPKIHSIALGYRFLFHGEEIYKNLHSHTPQDSVNKKKKVMFNNKISHNPKDRRACLGNLTKNFEGVDPPIQNTFTRGNTLENYYNEMVESQFVVSPKGLGGDCYRNYEAIFTGCIPIIEIEREEDGWRRIFDDLPVVFVKGWEGVTPEFVQKEYRRVLEGGPYNWKKTTRSWWIQHIRDLVENHVASQ